MHVPQIRCIRNNAGDRRSVRPASEHRQRENLRVHVVLVHNPSGYQWSGAGVPRGRRFRHAGPLLSAPRAGPSGSAQRGRTGGP